MINKLNLKSIISKIDILTCSAVLGLACVKGNLVLPKNNLENKVGFLYNDADKNTNNFCWIESDNWIITSYGDVNETLYNGKKIEIFNKEGNSLGFYREDFLKQVRINGSGIGDGIRNNKTKFLHYDYDINDRTTCYLSDVSLGAYNNTLVPWTGEKPSIAVNPILPYGTKIRFKNLGANENLIPQWIKDLLLNKTFYADDRFFLPEEDKNKKKIDVYVGLIESKGYGAQSLYMENATIMIESNSDFNRDNFVDYLDLKIFADNWLQSSQTEYNKADLNYDSKVNFHDYTIFADRLMQQKF